MQLRHNTHPKPICKGLKTRLIFFKQSGIGMKGPRQMMLKTKIENYRLLR